MYGIQRPLRRRSSAHGNAMHAQSEVEGGEAAAPGVAVVARISRHLLRLEREYKLAERLWKESGNAGKHFIRPLRLIRLQPRRDRDVPLVAMVVEAPGRNYLKELVELGPNFYSIPLPSSPVSPRAAERSSAGTERAFRKVPLKLFLDFAVGAAECCEILHHGNEIVHGELRGDAFHFNKETSTVKLINFGSGARSFENGLTSAGWSSLMSERGVEHKLQFIAPEQTGRLPAEPDSRTDIYSLGILFWTMLTGEPAFAGTTPLDIMQNVLSRRIPPVDSKRPDVPHTLSLLVQKMTQKNMDDRYQSTSGLRYDLTEIRRLVSEGDSQALDAFKLGTKDVTCFFNLPSTQIGRERQRQAIVDVIARTAERTATALPVSKKGLMSLSSHSSGPSGLGPEGATLDDAVSESTGSNPDDHDRVVPPSDPTSALKKQHQQPSQDSIATVVSDADMLDPKLTLESRASITSYNSERTGATYTSSPDVGLFRTAQKLKSRGHCEVVGLSGSAGLGKSSLLQSIQVTARSHGYFASAKFDQVKRAPFEPILRVMSSLFRQIFSENDVSTPFHNNIRRFVAPAWGVLHTYLELPPWLLSANSQHQPPQSTPSQVNGTPASALKCGTAGNTATDWLRQGGSNKQSRFVNTFLDVLRLLAYQKFICFCLDDLQFADPESANLLQNIAQANIPIVLILTFRSESSLPPKIKDLLQTATKVDLAPFTEEETAEYVSTTLHRPQEYVLPLVAVVQEKTRGNPFFIREMLDTCYRTQCIFYSWKSSQWEYDLDKVFNEFSSPDANKFSSNDFIARRLQELPPNSRALLCWASLIGNTFSFSLIKHLMSCDCSKASPAELLPPFDNDAVAGLQGALSAYTIMATDDEDKFRFSHDRYMQAADTICGAYSKEEMNYVIATALMKHDPYDRSTKPTKLLFDQSRHVCSAIEVIKKRAPARAPFRDLLYQAAETAREQGARTISLYFFQHSLELLSDDPWQDNGTDIQYQETLTLCTKAAASYWYLGYFDEAQILVKEIMMHARDAADKSPAFIIQSRMHAQRGDSFTAFISLKRALADLGIEIREPTWQECDEDFQDLAPLLQTTESKLPDVHGVSIDRELLTLGAVFVELLSSAFWSDSLLFYATTLRVLRVYLERGLFPQVGLAYVHLSSIAIARFGMIDFGIEIAQRAMRLFDYFDHDSYTVGRGMTLHSLFIGHLHTSIPEQLPLLERGMEATISAGDKILHLLNVGIVAAYRFWSAHDLGEIEAYIAYQDEAFPNWHQDFRGGVFLISVRQYSRALQGKTLVRSAATVLDDSEHESSSYCNFIATRASAPERPMSIYNSYRLVTLYRFGYFQEALEFGDSIMDSTKGLWCMRYTYSNMFYMSMSIMATLRDTPNYPQRHTLLQRVRGNLKTLQNISRFNDVNYASWMFLIEAELAEEHGDFDRAIICYESSINHATGMCRSFSLRVLD